MKNGARLLGHAVHPILIVFPLGLLVTAVVFDIIYLISDRPSFALAAGYTMAAGIIGGVLAAIFGVIDWRTIEPGTRASRVATQHGVGNAIVMALFVISWLLRVNGDQWRPSVLALVCSFAGVALAAVTGWLGGELVERLGIGVDRDAGPNAPSSLEPARREAVPR